MASPEQAQMRAPLIALGVVISLVVSAVASSQEPGAPNMAFNIHPVAGNVYVLERGDGFGNVAVLVGSDGLVLVDAQGEPQHPLLLAALKRLSDKPVRYVIDTHCHGDHSWGNAAFQRDGATVIAHSNVRKRLATESYCGPRPGTGLPTVTFDSQLTLYVDDEEIRITKLPAGHTDGDAMVYFKKANVVETGDAFVSVRLPGADPSKDGTMLGIIQELQRIIQAVPEDAKVIPGHGTQASIGDVRRSLQVLEGMRDAIQRPLLAGKSLDEIRAMNVLSPWKDTLGEPCVPHVPCDHQDAEAYLRSFFTALTAARAPANGDSNQKSHP